MVTIEQLEALDYRQWFRSGIAAAELSCCDESQISRRSQACTKIFRLKIKRCNEYELVGDSTLLNMQRAIHQYVRFSGSDHILLRLDATHLIRKLLLNPPLVGWILGPCDHRGNEVMLSLLRNRVIDAYITSDLLGLPQSNIFSVILLWNWPGELHANSYHPLHKQRKLSRGDIDQFPSLVIPQNLYPEIAASVHAMGFGKNSKLDRFDIGSWDRIGDDNKTLFYGSCLSQDANADVAKIFFNTDYQGGEALIILREFLNSPAISLLIEDLKARYKLAEQKFPQLVYRFQLLKSENSN